MVCWYACIYHGNVKIEIHRNDSDTYLIAEFD